MMVTIVFLFFVSPPPPPNSRDYSFIRCSCIEDFDTVKNVASSICRSSNFLAYTSFVDGASLSKYISIVIWVWVNGI